MFNAETQSMRQILIGVFVLGAMTIGLLFVVLLGSGVLFSKEAPFVIFFDGSVKGLRVGAPVTFRGVNVGTVDAIRVEFDPDDYSFRTPVFVKVDADRVVSRREGWRLPMWSTMEELGEELVKRGLRARLELQSLVTGQLLVDLNFYDEADLTYRGVGDEGVPEIPSLPSSLQELSKTLEDTSISDLVGDVRATLASIKSVVASGKLEATLESIQTAADAARTTFEGVNEKVVPLSVEFTSAAEEFRKVLVGVQGVMAAFDHHLQSGKGVPVSAQIETLLQQIEKMARSMRSLSEYLERHPEGIAFGKRS